ncbi:hypothetical protein F442_13079 [Phytophthora nicotianae P10297]|uniref:Uncharacterized protein n=5 Tax=Phytophthora nicotianae TaxID=4792 RepID=W2R440_PHYN3|nr:hypothetical protein PPTG_03244 [Phytophthora nicotianae INRA-310]ETI41565.1 hypothetical protein F443_13213 [Phytophthora nicotianae P1569]ETK81618.1 hypothetical protein L915_12897 [Phytophthora nicotianae]ETO70218.1 hypothetical protein F444_13282 [Phytophthora nicotianae P1976]ETP39459.1 hypothetical protein F442_13079 [Phytophthora nicotianae P10297]ETL88258.1 hypothetical protein L917_12650 [Phytophthora nicotianae]
MLRSRVALALLAATVCNTGTQAIDWTFWNDKDDSAPSPASSNAYTETLSPETLATMVGSDYLDNVKELIYSGKGSDLDSASGSTSEAPGSTASSSSSMLDTDDDSASTALSLAGSSAWDLAVPSMDEVATPSTAVNMYESIYRNWVGPWRQSEDPACYREAHFMKKCPSNYDRNELTNTCWTECPMGYPVECGMQCILQNNDCGRENAAKVSAVAMATLSMASFGVFGQLAKYGRKVSWAVACANYLLVFVRAVIRFTRNQVVNEPETPMEKLLLLLYQTGFVVADLPATIYACSGKPVPPNLQLTRQLLPTAQLLLLLTVAYDDEIIRNWEKFKAFMKRANFTEAAEQLTEGEISSLETGMKQNSTCGDDLKMLTTQVWMTVDEYRQKNPKISEGELRLKLSESDLILYHIPTVTNNCMPKMISESTVATAYKTRETLRKTYSLMINDLIKSGKSDNGTSMAAKHNAYTWLRNGLWLASYAWDPTDLSTLFAEFLQTICGPTQFMGEIDDGNELATLGMNALHKAFKNSTLSWKKKGDGAVIVNFKSNDTKDVTINIKSGGDKVGNVKLKAGGTAQWRSNVTTLGGKTLYMDRWRPGFLGLPGTGGGSLVLWVPISRQGGHLEINAQLNVS